MDNSEMLEASQLTQEEQNLALELGNLTAGTASPTLAMLIDQDLQLGQPELMICPTLESLAENGVPEASVLAVIQLTNGFQIPMAFILEMPAALKIADILMGGGTGDAASEASDIQLGAIGEAISQMMGAVANHFSQTLSHPMEISTPVVSTYSLAKLQEGLPKSSGQPLVGIRYKLAGSAIVPDCELIQIMSIEAMRQQIQVLNTPVSPDVSSGFATPPGGASRSAGFAAVEDDPFLAPPGSDGFSGASGGESPVTVQPVEFPSFDKHVSAYGGINKNLELVMDVTLNLTVELGRSELPIKEVLELTRGSVIELNRIAGEAIDLYANGKMIAKGEVVVIEDNFGLRITSIVSPVDRLRGL